MNLNYIHRGRQFFFITLALVGRPKVMSQLVDEAHRPRFTWYGEVVRLAFLALHKVYAAVTLSDFAIMPEHLHYLLIIDYDRAPTLNPLWLSHRLMDAIEAAWHAREQAPEPLPGENAQRQTMEPAMPDMVAMLRWAIALGQANAARVVEGQAPMPLAIGNSGLRFDRRCYIELAFSMAQLKTVRRYIKLNPARALWKQRHPDRFMRFANICHQVLDAARNWQGMGNLTLLGSPFLFHVRLTLKKSVAEHEGAIAEIVEKARRGWIPVSGFISPGEVEALRRLKATPGTRFIKMLPCSLPPRYDPSAEDSRELAADRLLILSGFTATPAISGHDIRRMIGASRQFRANCLAMNDLAAELCQRARGEIGAHS